MPRGKPRSVELASRTHDREYRAGRGAARLNEMSDRPGWVLVRRLPEELSIGCFMPNSRIQAWPLVLLLALVEISYLPDLRN